MVSDPKKVVFTLFQTRTAVLKTSRLVSLKTGRQEDEDGKTLVCDKRDRAISLRVLS